MSTTRRTFLRTAAAAVFGTLAGFYAPRLASIDDGWEESSIMQERVYPGVLWVEGECRTQTWKTEPEENQP